MKKTGLILLGSLILAACAQTGSGSAEAYGEISTGIETARTVRH